MEPTIQLDISKREIRTNTIYHFYFTFTFCFSHKKVTNAREEMHTFHKFHDPRSTCERSSAFNKTKSLQILVNAL